ncbi:MAG TPA: hypothetical protein PLY93_09605 [Turneriella sp.]|nr:hypothetical protein [Turneriella sp.]
MNYAPREEFTSIRVTREGKWFAGAKEIINYKVISHFKQNLFCDEKGVYIHQTFHQFAEKGYIIVEGPLLSVFRIDDTTLTLDSLDTMPINETEVIQNSDDDALYVFYPRLKCYASVPASVAPDFSRYLEEEGDGFTFLKKPIERKKIQVWL